jgi:hypothetical protein
VHHHQEQLENIPEVESDSDDLANDKSEMTEQMVQSSPVWQFFEPEVEDENQVKCVECDKVRLHLKKRKAFHHFHVFLFLILNVWTL